MNQLFKTQGYCIDTCAILDLWFRRYPRDVFPALWKRIEELISQGKIIAPKQVKEELKQKSIHVFNWVKNRRGMIIDNEPEQIECAKKIQNDFKGLVDPLKTRTAADPFLIALAKVRNWTVITTESVSLRPERPKIPNVCRKLGIECIDLVTFFRREHWVFD